MKVSGIIRHCITVVLSAPALLIANPACGQIYFASQKNSPIIDPERKPTAQQDSYDIIRSKDNLGNRYVISGSLSSFENTVRRTDIYLKPAVIDSSGTNTSISSNSEEPEIRFKTTSFAYPTNSTTDVGVDDYSSELLVIYAKALKEYARKNGFDTGYAFLSNMGMLSNKKRFFVMNLLTMKIEQAGLVSNGRGLGATIYDKQYSDEEGSRCTSLGRYEIMKRYKGNYGEAYRMTGLDSTNSNAYRRNIVLHSMNCIPDFENLAPACVSDGCPSVSAKFLASLGKIIDSRKKPMLLWIFDSNLEEPVAQDNFAELISPELFLTATKDFSINSDHVNRRLHIINLQLKTNL